MFKEIFLITPQSLLDNYHIYLLIIKLENISDYCLKIKLFLESFYLNFFLQIQRCQNHISHFLIKLALHHPFYLENGLLYFYLKYNF